MDSRRLIIFLAILGMQVLLCVFLFRDSVSGSSRFLFWVQTIAGNWSPPGPSPGAISPADVVLSGGLATALNIGGLIYLYGIMGKLIMLEKRQAMDAFNDITVQQIYSIRDLSIRNKLVTIISQEINANSAALSPALRAEIGKLDVAKIVDDGFKAGDDAWRRRLRIVFKNKAEKLARYLELLKINKEKVEISQE